MLEHEELFSCSPLPPGRIFFFPLVYFSSLYNSYARSYFKNPRSLQKNKSLWHSASLFLWNRVSYISWSEKKVAAFLNLFFFSVHKSPRIWVNGLLWKRRQQQVEEALLNLFVCIMTPLSVATPRKRKDPSQIDGVCRRKSQSFTPHRVALTWRKSI